jgi:AAA15 family ATPase/GTPase
MIVNYTIENFLSIKEPQVISFWVQESNLPDNEVFSCGEDFQLYKSVVLFGANSSGKSNVLIAMNYLSAISHTGELNPFDFSWFQNDDPTKLMIDFIVQPYDRRVYRYILKFKQGVIIHEELNYEDFTTEAINVLYSRSYQQDKPENPYNYEFAEEFKKDLAISTNTQNINIEFILDNVVRITAPNKLCLYQLLHGFNFQLINKYYYPLTNAILTNNKFLFQLDVANIRLNPNNLPINQFDFSHAINYYKNNEKAKQLLIEYLKSIGNRFDDIEFIQTPDGKITIQFIYNINGNKKILPITSESDGTLKYIVYKHLIDIMDKQNKMVLVDEIETHFHPLVVAKIIDYFNSENNQTNQLICTTHNPLFLDNDKYFRKDQIYFVDRTDKYQTNIYALSDFDLTKINEKGINYRDAYLQDRFGAVPNICI